MLRIAILADTHGHLDPRVADLVRDCDLAVHGGDIGSAGVLSALQPRSGRVHAVTGNNDLPNKWPAGEHGLLAAIPALSRLGLPGGDLVVVHGHRTPAKGRHQRLRRQYPEARAIVYGHSHRLVADCDDDPWVLNPGAAGRARTFGGPSCMTLTVDGHRWLLDIHRFEPAPRQHRHRSSDRPDSGADRMARTKI